MNWRLRLWAAVLVCSGLLLLPAGGASAHRLNVFAWQEGDQINVECNFGKGRPAMHIPVTVDDAETGTRILEGATSETGVWHFPLPAHAPNALNITAQAGEGHSGSWRMEIAGAQGDTAKAEAAAPDAESKTDNAPSSKLLRPDQTQPVVMLTRDEARKILQEELQRELGPIRRELAARNAQGPTLPEIVGGLGWIVGLVGAGLFFRRKSQ